MIVAALGLSWLNGRTVQHIVNQTGKTNAELWLMKPGLWVHETAHAVVGRLFGLQIQAFSVRPSANGRSAGHVTFRFDQHSPWQRLGLFFAGGAPLWVVGLITLTLGKHAFWPGVPLALVGWQTMLPSWPWVLGWLVVALLLSLGASLSAADLHTMWRGLPVFALVLLVAALLLQWLAPAALTWWREGNLLLAMIFGLLTAVALAVNWLSHLLWR